MQLDRILVVRCVYVAWCSCLGCLVRLFLDDVQSQNIALQGSVLSNAIGCFAMGVMVDADLSEDNLPGLYTGVTVGVLGSLTTYSGWNLRVAWAALGDAAGPSGGIVTVVAVIVWLTFFVVCRLAGGDLVKSLARAGRIQCRGIRGGIGSTQRALSVLGLVFAILVVLLVVDDNTNRRDDWVACLFAPFGALLRFALASLVETVFAYVVCLGAIERRTLDHRCRGGAFPLGIFLANVLGSLALGLTFYVAPSSSRSGWRGIVLQGFEKGFLGCLTTMSTFVAQVVGHREVHSVVASYVYFFATAGAAIVIVVITGAASG